MGCNISEAVESIEQNKKRQSPKKMKQRFSNPEVDLYFNKKDYILISKSGFSKSYTLGQRIGQGIYHKDDSVKLFHLFIFQQNKKESSNCLGKKLF